VVGPGF